MADGAASFRRPSRPLGPSSMRVGAVARRLSSGSLPARSAWPLCFRTPKVGTRSGEVDKREEGPLVCWRGWSSGVGSNQTCQGSTAGSHSGSAIRKGMRVRLPRPAPRLSAHAGLLEKLRGYTGVTRQRVLDGPKLVGSLAPRNAAAPAVRRRRGCRSILPWVRSRLLRPASEGSNRGSPYRRKG